MDWHNLQVSHSPLSTPAPPSIPCQPVLASCLSRLQLLPPLCRLLIIAAAEPSGVTTQHGGDGTRRGMHGGSAIHPAPSSGIRCIPGVVSGQVSGKKQRDNPGWPAYCGVARQSHRFGPPPPHIVRPAPPSCSPSSSLHFPPSSARQADLINTSFIWQLIGSPPACS